MFWFSMARNPAIKYLGWGLIPLFLVVLLLILLGRTWGPAEPGPVVVLDRTDQVQKVRLGSLAQVERLEDHYIAPGAQRRERVLQGLSRFRADYKQLAPRLEIYAAPGSVSRRKVATRLGEALANYGLGQAVPAGEHGVPAKTGESPIWMRVSPSDLNIAHRLLAALSPYLAGEIAIEMDAGVGTGSMSLTLLGEPRFTETGLAVFKGADHGALGMPEE